MNPKSALRLALLLLAFLGGSTQAQPAADSTHISIQKIDPPNWFASMPKPMLLVHGEHLQGAHFQLSDRTVKIEKTDISANGHWAQLWLSRSPAQPETVQLTASRKKDHLTVAYTFVARRTQIPQGFSSKDVMYLIMPDRFADGDLTNDTLPTFAPKDDRSVARAYHGGDLKGIEDHLDYLKQLGVTTIWTTPVDDNSGNGRADSYHGYGATDLYAVDPHFGTLADYQALASAAHARGLKIVMDDVPNHLGPGHPWADDQPGPNWLHGTPASHVETRDDYTSVIDPTASAARRHLLLDGWFANVLPDVNQDNPATAQYLTQNAIWWIETVGLDGLRIDTFAYVPRSFWQGYNRTLHQLYPSLTDVGEILHPDAHVVSFWAGGRAHTGSDGSFDTGLDTPFDYPMCFTLRDVLTHKKPVSAIMDTLALDTLYPHPERLVTFFDNHDLARLLALPGATPAALRLGYGLLATLRGMPEIYYGDEIDMPGGDDPGNRHDMPGGFPGDTLNAFTGTGESAEQHETQAWVRTLLQLRARTPELQEGKQTILLADANTLAFTRSLSGASSQVLVVLNNDTAAHTVEIPVSSSPLANDTRFTPLLPSSTQVDHTGPTLHLHLAPQQIAIFRAQL